MAQIKHVFTINSNLENVYQAITTVNGLQSWWTVLADGKEELGGKLTFNFNSRGFIEFEILKLDKPYRIEWLCTDAHPEWIGTTATFELINSDINEVKVIFVHDGWENETEFYGSCNYSWGRYFESLKRYCETGIGKPFQTNTIDK